MGGVQRIRDLSQQRHDALGLERTIVTDHALQVVAGHVSHREVEDAAGLAGVVHVDDVRIVQRSGKLSRKMRSIAVGHATAETMPVIAKASRTVHPPRNAIPLQNSSKYPAATNRAMPAVPAMLRALVEPCVVGNHF